MAWPPVIPPANRTDVTDQAGAHPSDHNQLSQALTDVVAQLDVTSWVALPLAANWAHYGGGFAKGAYRRAGGRVELAGMIAYAGGGAIPGSTALFTLPAGFRGAAAARLTVGLNGGLGFIDVTAAGVATWAGNLAGATGGFVVLFGASFPLVAVP